MIQKPCWTEVVLASDITLNEVTMICRMKKDKKKRMSLFQSDFIGHLGKLKYLKTL